MWTSGSTATPPAHAGRRLDLAGLKVLSRRRRRRHLKTLEIVRDFCAEHVAEARTAVIYEKPWTVIHPDFVWRRTESWIDFPWSASPPGPAVPAWPPPTTGCTLSRTTAARYLGGSCA